MFLILRESADYTGDDIYVIESMCLSREELVMKLAELKHVHGVEKSLYFEAAHTLDTTELSRDVDAAVQKMKDAEAAEAEERKKEEAVRLAKWRADGEEQRKRMAADDEARERAAYERLRAKYEK